jgi:hypothetical protein
MDVDGLDLRAIVGLHGKFSKGGAFACPYALSA